jgi:AhpD family alkylhydroperoxidase
MPIRGPRPLFSKRHYASPGALLSDLRATLPHLGAIGQAMRTVNPAFRIRLMLAVTEVNGCRYCAYYHTHLALRKGMTTEEVACLLDGKLSPDRPDEAAALLYAQHWAETRSQPEPEARQRLVTAYGNVQAGHIEGVLRAIMLGNYWGNTFDALLFRLSGGRWGT